MPDFPPSRRIGSNGPASPAIALGCYTMSSAYGQRHDADSERVIARAIDLGLTVIDTADYYGWGHNESLVGRALKGRRESVVLSSKFGYVRAEGAAFGLCSRPSYVREACEASLLRLGTDRIDLYFQHRLDPAVPIEDTVGAMADLVRQGKVRRIGLCEVSERTLRRAHAIHPIAAVQAEYSLWTRDPEARMLDVYAELGVTLLAFSPLGRGMLTGKLRSLDQLEPGDVRRRMPRFSPENFPRNVALVDRLAGIASRNQCSISQLALAWLTQKAPGVIAICGCDTLSFLEENVGALAVRLDPATLDEIDAMFAAGAVAGDRYSAFLKSLLDRE